MLGWTSWTNDRVIILILRKNIARYRKYKIDMWVSIWSIIIEFLDSSLISQVGSQVAKWKSWKIHRLYFPFDYFYPTWSSMEIILQQIFTLGKFRFWEIKNVELKFSPTFTYFEESKYFLLVYRFKNKFDSLRITVFILTSRFFHCLKFDRGMQTLSKIEWYEHLESSWALSWNCD